MMLIAKFYVIGIVVITTFVMQQLQFNIRTVVH